MPQEYKHTIPNPASFNFRGLLLYLLPSPLIFKLLISILWLDPIRILLSAGALFFFYSAAHLTRTSLLRLVENHQRPKAKKIHDYRQLALIYVGVGTLILMFLTRRHSLAMLIMPLTSMVGYYLVYGIKAPQAQQPVDFDAMPKATREAIQGAYRDLEHIEQLSQKLRRSDDKTLVVSVDKVVEQSYKVLDLLSHSPNDAGRARRFLNVYINRIKEILSQYIGLAEYGKGDDYRKRLIDVLDETYQAFSEQASKLLDDDQFKLDVQLEVLDEQIKSEKNKE